MNIDHRLWMSSCRKLAIWMINMHRIYYYWVEEPVSFSFRHSESTSSSMWQTWFLFARFPSQNRWTHFLQHIIKFTYLIEISFFVCFPNNHRWTSNFRTDLGDYQSIFYRTAKFEYRWSEWGKCNLWNTFGREFWNYYIYCCDLELECKSV